MDDHAGRLRRRGPAGGGPLQTQNPVRSYLEHGIRVSLGSDQLPYSLLFNILERRDPVRLGRRGVRTRGGEYGRGGIRLHTLGAAYRNFDEDVRGSIGPGKIADTAVLDADIVTVAPEQIREVRAERTIIGGREVFVRPADIHNAMRLITASARVVRTTVA